MQRWWMKTGDILSVGRQAWNIRTSHNNGFRYFSYLFHNCCHKKISEVEVCYSYASIILMLFFSFVQNWEMSLQPFCHQARVNSTEELVRRQVLVRKSLKATEQRTTSPDFQCNQMGHDGSSTDYDLRLYVVFKDNQTQTNKTSTIFPRVSSREQGW